MGFSTLDEQLVLSDNANLVAADGTTNKVIGAPHQRGHRYDAVLVVSTSASDHKLAVSVYDGSNHHQIGSVDVPAGAGTAGAAAVDLVSALLLAAIGGVVFSSLCTLSVRLEVTLTGGEVMIITAFGGAF